MHDTTRREFLKCSAAAASASVLTAPPAVLGANDRIRVAIVGLRNRGTEHISSLHQMAKDNVEIAALCDCDESMLNARAAEYEKRAGKKVPTFTDMRKILDDKTIDAVSFATPNHWHSLAVIWACQAGKDAYVEKPGSHNIFEGRKMVEAARNYKRIVQHGTQCRTSPKIREGIARLREGVIGRVYLARGIAFKIRNSLGREKSQPVPKGLDWNIWQGPAPEKPYSTFRRNCHHYVWDYGNGEIGNQGVHQFDMIRWGLGMDTHPTRIQAMGGSLVHEDDQQTPGILTSACEYEGRKILVEFEVRNWHTNHEAGMGDKYPFVDHRNVVGVIFLGTEGYMIIPDYSSYRTFLGPKREPGPSAFVEGEPMMDLDHFQNWIAAVRSRKPSDLNAEIEQGHLSSAICHLTNIAYRTGRTVRFDPKTEQFPDDPEANKLLTRPYRAPFVVPDQV